MSEEVELSRIVFDQAGHGFVILSNGSRLANVKKVESIISAGEAPLLVLYMKAVPMEAVDEMEW